MKVDTPFSCTLCGECCSGSMRVFLNTYDLYKIGRFYKLNHTEELFQKGLVEWADGQNDLQLPKIRFKSYPFPFCPFLMNDFSEELGLRGLCSLHPDHKPLVCKLAPLAREVDLDTGRDSFSFIPPHPDCPGCGKGDPIDIENEKETLREELVYERELYRLLREREESPETIRELYLFSLDRDFKERFPSV